MNTINPMSVAEDFYAAIEKAWNSGDGPAFGDAFADVTEFVDVRGVQHRGGPAQVGAMLVHTGGAWKATAFHNTLVTV